MSEGLGHLSLIFSKQSSSVGIGTQNVEQIQHQLSDEHLCNASNAQAGVNDFYIVF